MMTRCQYLLGKIAEEAVEVAQRALKAQQFGLEEVQKGHGETNEERLFHEVWDLMVTLTLLGSHIPLMPDGYISLRRRERMREYLRLSQQLGQVSGDAEL